MIDDTLDLLQGCSDKAMTGKEAQAWQMWDDAQEEQRGCSKTAELKKRETAAEANLKLKAQTDQALYLAMQLGQQSAMYGGKTGNSFQQQQQGQGKGHGQQQQAWQGQAWQQQQQQGWQPQQQGWPAQGGADSKADTTRATTEQSFPGAGWWERRKREGEDGRYIRDPYTVQLWQG